MALAVESLGSASKYWVALSGGLDSQVLLHALVTLSEHRALPSIEAIHVNHQLHPEAETWARHCGEFCENLGITLTIATCDIKNTGEGPEASARSGRYRVFENLLCVNELLLMAHHQDDQIETVLFRLLRGAGVKGLGGIPERRQLGKGRLGRPLLDVPKTEIEEWAVHHGLHGIADPTNNSVDFDRNFLRNRVLPIVAQRWPGYRSAIARSAHLQKQIFKNWSSELLPHCVSACGDPGLTIDPLLDSPDALASTLYLWLLDLVDTVPTHATLVEFARQLLSAPSGRNPKLILNSLVLQRWRDKVYCLPSADASSFPECFLSGKVSMSASGEVAWVRDENGIPEGVFLTARMRQPGEVFKMLSRSTKPLNQSFQEANIPPWWRDRLPILCFGGLPVAIIGLGLTAEAESVWNSSRQRCRPVWQPRHRVLQ